MKYLKLFENYNREDIDSICKKYGIENYSINVDGSIDVYSGVDLCNKGLTELPLKFRSIKLFFDCGENKLTTLKGCPESVGTAFHCYDNRELTSLEGGPKFVGGDLLCHDNNIKTLEGFPISVGGRIRLDRNPVWILWNLFSSPELRSRFAGQRHTNSIDNVELFNDFGITDGEVVILDRLNEFLEMIGLTDAHVSQVPLTNSILQKIERNYRLI